MVSGGDLRVVEGIFQTFVGADPAGQGPKAAASAAPTEPVGFWESLLRRLVSGGQTVERATPSPYVRRELRPGECGVVGFSQVTVCQ